MIMSIISIITITILSNALSILITLNARNGFCLSPERNDAAALSTRCRRPDCAVDDLAELVALVNDPLRRNVGRDVANEHLDISKTIE